MLLKIIDDENFNHYKKPSMVLGFPICTFKCDKEYGMQVCQNSTLAAAPSKNIDIKSIVKRYMNNLITSAICCGGLEPFDSWDDLYKLVACIRNTTNDDIVIFTGYYKEEIIDKISELITFGNIIVKYGRYIPGQESHMDKVLGIRLASDNQYGEKIC